MITRIFQLTHPLLTVSLLGMLAFALIAETFFDIHPCQLCMYQRYLMITAFLICMMASFTKNCLMRWLSMLSLAACAFFALYQVGVELHWWQSHFGCSATDALKNSLEVNSASSLDQQLQTSHFVPCDKPSWWIFGVSATIWTFLSLSFLWILSCLALCLTRSAKN